VRIKALVEQYGSPFSLFERQGRSALVQWPAHFPKTSSTTALLDAPGSSSPGQPPLALRYSPGTTRPILRCCARSMRRRRYVCKGQARQLCPACVRRRGNAQAEPLRRNAAEHIVKQLVEKRVVIVSGLAHGSTRWRTRPAGKRRRHHCGSGRRRRQCLSGRQPWPCRAHRGIGRAGI